MLKRFPASLDKLAKNEQNVIKKLGAASEIIGELYLRQKNPKYQGANFYPHDATREEIESAAKHDAAILDPYTVVERNQAGRLVAIPYGEKFRKELSRVAALLREAAGLTKDKNLARYLCARAEDLFRSNYDESNILWLQTERSKIGCVIGAFDRYLDKLFFRKRAFMAWIGILDEKLTKEMEIFKATILASERKYLPGAKRAKIPTVKIRIEESIVFSGLIADFLFVGNNLPSSADLYLIKKYGALFTVFKPTLEWRFSTWIFPIFQSIFQKDFQGRYSREELFRSFVQSTVLHEACHSLMRYDDAATRLQEFFPYFDEIYTDILGVKGCGTLLLKGAVTDRELETLLLVEICHALYFYGSLGKRPHLDPYAAGSALLLDFLVKGEALQLRNKHFSVDFHRTFIAVDQLSHILEYYIALASRSEAEVFLRNHVSHRVFSKFAPLLRRIKEQ